MLKNVTEQNNLKESDIIKFSEKNKINYYRYMIDNKLNT